MFPLPYPTFPPPPQHSLRYRTFHSTNVLEDAPQFLSGITPGIQSVLLKIKQSPTVAVRTSLTSDFDPDALSEARNIIFNAAKDKYRERSRTQHGDLTDSTFDAASIDNYTMKVRRSTDTTADDIRELCLYMFDHRQSFPKSCLSSSSNQLRSKQPQKAAMTDCSGNETGAMITQPQSIDKTPTGNDVNIATLQSILMGVAQIQNYIKMLDIKFSEKISAISDKLNLVHSDKEMIQQLNNERRDLQATIDMLMRVDSAHSRGDKAYANQPPRDSTSSHSALSDATPVITANRFTLLADTTELTDTTEDPVTEAERLIDSYYDVLNSNQCAKSKTREIKNKQAKPIPFQEQLNQYRKRHRDQLIRPTSCHVSPKLMLLVTR